jgi:hypothetical protein
MTPAATKLTATSWRPLAFGTTPPVADCLAYLFTRLRAEPP